MLEDTYKQQRYQDYQSNFDDIMAQIMEISTIGIGEMFDTDSQLFCYRVIRNSKGLTIEGTSLRYTLISLLGLSKIEKRGYHTPVNIRTVLDSIIEHISEFDNNLGDLGLFLWLCALAYPQKLQELFSNMENNNAIKLFSVSREGRTMELSWLLAGLTYSYVAIGDYLPVIKELIHDTYMSLKDNYGGKGIFWHSNKRTLNGLIRGRVGSFADQVYPMYALSIYSRTFRDAEALMIALECAENICHLQGPLGQWWWHYDAHTGKVVGRYPVYSVHQDGMAPMALSAVSKASGIDFSENIIRGLNWIRGKNELGIALMDQEYNVIWRSFYGEKSKSYIELAMSLFRKSLKYTACYDLKVNYECRPYHLGWILYAFG